MLKLLILLAIYIPVYAQTPTSPVFAADSLNRLYIVGLQYMNNGDLTEAEIAFRSIVAFPPQSTDWRTVRYFKGKAHVYLGDIYFVQKQYQKSVEQYQMVASDYAEIEEYSMTLYKLGRSLILAGKEVEGIQVLNDYNYNYGTQDRVADNSLYWIAQGYIGLHNYTAALRVLHQILRDFPDSPMAYDVRILVAKMETSLESSPPSSAVLDVLEDQNRITRNNLLQEKELIDRIKQLLQIKENLLQIQEKKLELLENVSGTRSELMKQNN